MTTNRLGSETSPYLLQHKDNPVHWWPWGSAALAEAKRSGKPILLSVGYAACHWCHVMAHESFEDEATARVMNELFVNIKVDREERPDVDAIYMSALHRLGQQGGWPLTMFLDSDARPFWGGTYFPKAASWGRPAFVDLLHQVARIYHNEPDKVRLSASALTDALKEPPRSTTGLALTDDLLRQLAQRMAGAVDPVAGGIRGAPKFPQWSFFWLLWRSAIAYDLPDARAAVTTTLVNICQGGIYDHLGGGFARYAVDERWLVPHFEKMLYDNALLVDLMTEVWRETQEPVLAARVGETIAWLAAEMVADGGGFAASLDADSEGEEGKFYVWTAAEVGDVLGPEDACFFSAFYDVSANGNWEGRTILNRLAWPGMADPETEARLALLRDKLLAARRRRTRPGWDDKVLADWNGLAIAAVARAAVVFERPAWLDLAKSAYAFVRSSMVIDGRLWHSARGGRVTAPAVASDYANMIWSALRLHQATLDETYLADAVAWTQTLETHYWDPHAGGYAVSADDTTDIIARLRTAHDDATPNANAVMVSVHAALALLTGETRHAERAQAIFRAFSADLAGSLLGHCGLLSSWFDSMAPQLVVLAAGETDDGSELRHALNRLSLPGALRYDLEKTSTHKVLDVLSGKLPVAGRAAVYCCLGPQCEAPVVDAPALTKLLKLQRRR